MIKAGNIIMHLRNTATLLSTELLQLVRIYQIHEKI